MRGLRLRRQLVLRLFVAGPLKEDGSAGPMSEMATIPDCVADGITRDREGSVWLTCYSFGTAYRVSPEAKIQQKITTERFAWPGRSRAACFRY